MTKVATVGVRRAWCLVVVSSCALGRAQAAPNLPHPSSCEAPMLVARARLLFAGTAVTRPSDCSVLASAAGNSVRDPELAQRQLDAIDGPLRQSRELRWLSGRVALARGRAQAAFTALRPDIDGWPQETYTLWDLAVAATLVQQDTVAREAYQRLAQSAVMGGRARIAMRIELAVLESRRGEEGMDEARSLVALIDWSDTDPDTCPWVATTRVYLDQLQPSRQQIRGPTCSRQSTWARWLGSSDGARAVFAAVPRSNDWLRLPPNERLSLAALGLGDTSPALRRRLWSAVDASSGSALEALKRRELAKVPARR